MDSGKRHSDGLRGEYLMLSIIPTGSKPMRFSTPWLALPVALALGLGLIVALQ